MATEPWATLRVELAPEGDPPAADADASQRLVREGLALEGLAALVAEGADVGGVETRDATTLGGVTRPELWIYTTPAALDRVRAHVAALAPTLGLSTKLTARVRDDDDWRDEWKQFYRPQHFGAPPWQLLLRPSWRARAPEDPEREIVLDPGHAFGTGLHQSTRLCLQRLCTVASEIDPTAAVLDLGCGSGILALAAARLAPGISLTAADVDADATATTRENAERNGLGDAVSLHTGPLATLPTRPFDWVVANIRPVVLVPLAAEIRGWLAPGARVLLSGIYGDEVTRVAEAWREAGFAPVYETRDEDWSLLDLSLDASPEAKA